MSSIEADGERVGADAASPQAVAQAFTSARRAGRALPGFPGPVPSDLASAYRIQEAAIALWPQPVIGWKLGRIAPELAGRLGAGRLAGPAFAGAFWTAGGEAPVETPVIPGGFAAVEAEYVLRIGRDADPGRTRWSLEDAAEMVDAAFVGVEIAGSPLATINALGPTVVVSDFGNHAGLVLGPRIEDWADRGLDSLTCRTVIDGEVVGQGGAADIPDGPLDSVRFLLEHLVSRGRPLRRGDLVSTGAATGIHEVGPGARARVDFGRDGAVEVATVAARPQT